jgi:iron complex outermembrane receptor protein
VNDLLVAYSIFPKFMDEITFSVKINNLLNAEYETNAWVYKYYSEGVQEVYDGYFPQAGTNFLAGLTLRF